MSQHRFVVNTYPTNFPGYFYFYHKETTAVADTTDFVVRRFLGHLVVPQASFFYCSQLAKTGKKLVGQPGARKRSYGSCVTSVTRSFVESLKYWWTHSEGLYPTPIFRKFFRAGPLLHYHTKIQTGE